MQIHGIRAWSDSQVALWWIRDDTSRWKPFVANRVSEIVEMLPANHWVLVKGAEDPADLISRGTTLHQPKDSELWWAGQRWLLEEPATVVDDAQDPVVNEALKGDPGRRAKEISSMRSCPGRKFSTSSTDH